MTKLFVLPLMLATVAGITGGTAVEAKPWVSGPGVDLEPFIVQRNVAQLNVHVHECLN